MDAINRHKVHRAATGFVNLVFPPRCLLCGSVHHLGVPLAVLCRDCLRQLEPASDQKCGRCGAFVEKLSSTCDGCNGSVDSTQEANGIWAWGPYAGRIRDAVLTMKHRGQEPLAFAMGKVMARKLTKTHFVADVDLVTSIPIHWTRRASRGYNVPEMLVEPIARQFGLASAGNLLEYVRKTKKQGTLAPRERIENVRGAIGIRRRGAIRGARVLIVDDVMTTGATVNEATRACLAAGASCVKVAIIARARGIGNTGSSAIAYDFKESDRR